MQMISKVKREYQEACDVKNLINLTMNVKLLLGSLLTPEQVDLFMNQRKRAFNLKSTKYSSEGSDDQKIWDPFGTEKQFTSELSRHLSHFRTTQRLDRSLLLGVLPDSPKKRPIYRKRHQVLPETTKNSFMQEFSSAEQIGPFELESQTEAKPSFKGQLNPSLQSNDKNSVSRKRLTLYSSP